MFFSRKSGIKKHWTRLYKTSLTDLNALIEEDHPWRDWAANSFPDGTAQFEFNSAIRILAGSDNWDLARRYLARSIEIIDRIFDEDKLTSPGCDLRYPANSATCRRTRAYARSLLGDVLDTEALHLASREFETYLLKQDDPTDRNEQKNYGWIAGIHLSLIGNDLARTGDNKRHYSVLQGVMTLASGSSAEHEAREIIGRFETFFDWARDPRTKARGGEHLEVTIGPFELALLRDKYIQQQGDDLDWKRVLADYSR